MPVHGEPHYLVSDSFNLLIQLVFTHPFLGTLLIAAVFGGVLGILRGIFHHIAYETVVFALLISTVVLLLGAGLYVYTHVPGYYLGG